MTVTLDENAILQEVVTKIRNADIFTTTQRSVTTSSVTGTLSGTATLTIPLTSVKNVRSLTIGSTAMAYGTDYTINYGTGTTNAIITTTTTHTAAYTVSVDYGVDKIFPNYPRSDLTINSFPRIAVEFTGVSSQAGGFGNVNQNRYDLTITVYDFKKEDIRGYIKALRQFVITNQNSFYYLKLVKPTLQGPILLGAFDRVHDKIFQQSLDFRSILNLEVN